MGWSARFVCGLLGGLLMAAGGARANEGVGPSEVLLGQSAALSGPSAELGKLFQTGAQAYFDRVNAQGGIHGRKIRLLTLDDQFIAEKAQANTTQLIHHDKVFALFGYVGTPSAAAGLPLATQAGVPFFAPMTGARIVREPYNPLVFNIRASLARETDFLLRQLQGNGRRNIAVFYVNDEFGKATLELIRQRTASLELRLVAEVGGANTGEDAQAAARGLMKAKSDVVILVGTYPAAAAVIGAMRRAGYQGGFLNYSTVGSRSLAHLLKDAGPGTLVTQVVPFPWRASLPIVHEYQKAIDAVEGGRYSFVSMEGYIAARTFCEGLRRAGRKLTREGLIQALESINPGNYDGGGYYLRFGPGNHNGSDFVDLTAIVAGERFIN